MLLPLIEDFITEQPDWHPTTKQYYRNRLTHFATFCQTQNLTTLAAVDAGHLNRYLGRLRDAGLAWSTRNGAFTAIRAFFTWLRRRRHILASPFADPDSGLKRPRKIRKRVAALAVSHIIALIAAAEADGSLQANRDVAIMRLLAATGLRRHEVVTLQFNDLEVTGDELKLTVTGKGGHQRPAFVFGQAKKSLDAWLAVRPATTATTLFITVHPSKKGLHHPMQPDAVNDMLLKWRAAARLPTCKPCWATPTFKPPASTWMTTWTPCAGWSRITR